MSKYKVVSLFSGAGGLDLGFHKAGFDIIWANDFDKYAVQTYQMNFKNEIIFDDINNIDFNTIPSADVVIAGFPCQPFSMMGSELGFEDTRGTIFFTVANLIKQMINRGEKPKVVVLENVRRLLTHDGGNTFRVIKHVLEHELGYKVFYKVLNSSDYGVPQTRNRIFIVCFDGKGVDFNFPREVELKYTMQDLLEKNVDEKYFLSDRILKTILSNGTGNYKASTTISFVGTNSFNLVWEDVCSVVMDDCINKSIKELGLSYSKNPKQSALLLDVIAKPKWKHNSSGNVHVANKTLIPDIVTINGNNKW